MIVNLREKKMFYDCYIIRYYKKRNYAVLFNLHKNIAITNSCLKATAPEGLNAWACIVG